MKIKTKQITVTAIMLAICLVSQFFKNLSVYITGPIINAALILTVLYAGMACGIILSIINNQKWLWNTRSMLLMRSLLHRL